MRYRLRTLLVVVGVLPPLIARAWCVLWWVWFCRLSLTDVLWELGAALYIAAWVAVVIAWRWVHRPAAP